MTEWTTHTPAFDGDAPEGVTLDNHEIAFLSRASGRLSNVCGGDVWCRTNQPIWKRTVKYRYRPRMEDVKE